MKAPSPNADLELARSLFPRLHFDGKEPFFPVLIGVSILLTEGSSPSFRRSLRPPPGGKVVEYAIYWDWDIQHLYDLEHVWLYLDEDGEVADAETSFHGKFLKGLLPDRRNLRYGRLVLYSQPGKHAFSPLPEIFRLLPDCEEATGPAAGKAGAQLPWPLAGRVVARPEWDAPVQAWLRRHAFEPSWDFRPWAAGAECFVAWEELSDRLPGLFEKNLRMAGAL